MEFQFCPKNKIISAETNFRDALYWVGGFKHDFCGLFIPPLHNLFLLNNLSVVGERHRGSLTSLAEETVVVSHSHCIAAHGGLMSAALTGFTPRAQSEICCFHEGEVPSGC